MDRPIRIQRKRTRGWRLPPHTKCVTRPGRFGNPFTTAGAFRTWLEMLAAGESVPVVTPESRHMLRIAESLAELRGWNLACWCPPDKSCHADVLLELANR